MFDRVISIQNPAFRSQNLNDNATDEKNRSPAHSTACIYAFWEAVGGQIAALKSWNMPKVFVWQSCGVHRPCAQTDVVHLARQSACSRPTAPLSGMCWLNTVYPSAIWIDVVFCFHCFGLVKMGGKGLEVKGGVDVGAWRLVVSGFDWHVVILCWLQLASSSRLKSEFGCSPELQPGMCCWKDKGPIHQRSAELQINSLKLSRFITRSQRNFPELKKD